MTSVLIATSSGIRRLDGTAVPDGPPGKVDHLSAHDSGLVAISRDTVWTSSDGVAWRSRYDFRTGLGLSARCAAFAGTTLWVGTSTARLFRIDLADDAPPLEPVEDEEFADNADRQRWHTPWGGPPDTRSIAVTRDGTIFVNVHVGGILRRTPADPGWSTVLPIGHDTHEVAAHPTDGAVVVAATALGLAVSTNGGDDWTLRTDGMHATYCRAAAVTGDTVYVSASTGPGGARSAVYRATVEDGPLVRCRDGLPEWFSTNVDSGCLAAVDDAAYVGDETGEMFTSADGLRWSSVTTRFPGIFSVAAR